QERPMDAGIRRKFIPAPRARGVIHAMHAKIVITANTAPKKAERAASANDDSLNTARRVKYWEIIADNLKKRGWSLGYVSAIDSNGRTIWIADEHRGDGKRFVVRADDKLRGLLSLGVYRQCSGDGKG